MSTGSGSDVRPPYADAGRRPGVRPAPDPPGPWPRELLAHLRPASRDVRRVVAWLGSALGGGASLRDGDGGLVAGPDLPGHEELASDIASGRIASASVEHGGRSVRLVAVGRPPSPRVLIVWRSEPFDQRAGEILAHTAWVLEMLLQEHEMARETRRLRRATADLRLAILQLLMVEDTVSARRVAAGLWPGLLDTDGACVYILEGPPGHRDVLAEQCVELTTGRALVVRCPAEDNHVITVTPAGEHDEAARAALRTVVAGQPGAFLGGSVRHDLARVATAYGQAASALAVARFHPDRAATYSERTRPERLMDPVLVRRWAAHVLLPLDALPPHTYAELLSTTQLALEFTAVKTAKVMGVSRNTVRARVDRMAELLSADLSDLRARTAVRLALNTQAYSPDRIGRPADDAAAAGPPVGFAELLAGTELRAWAHDLLDRLAADARDLRATLCAWVACGVNAEQAGRRLGLHAQTVREHVRSGEQLLERRLSAGGGDLHDVVLALMVAGDLAVPGFKGV
ncbi:DNA-binding protein [Streptomyces minutiscleroticus]|uniref:DNA-binding protein n=1 Tax=Streptomyces minutiscleroticus TaxID=68238 RepID=A0A918U484_9ACTN|nr:DNA-binding protein [Streptomyces minutiscleroticus]